MASLVLNGDTSGSITLTAPAAAGTTTQTLVPTNGTLAPMISGTMQTASGASVDFTGIPSWVKRITVQLNGVSFAAATNDGTIRIGSGSLTSTGYDSNRVNITTTPTVVSNAVTDGFTSLLTAAAASSVQGVYVITNMGGNTWICTGQHRRAGDSTQVIAQGAVTLAGTLDRLSVVATTSTFDAGSINILYE